MLMVLALTGCATIPEERQGQVEAAVGVAVLAGAGIWAARSLAHSGATQVHPTPRTVLGPP